MLFQIKFIVEIQFIYYYAAVLLGIQISIYSIYLYFKNRDANLKLNRILLSFGAFTTLVLSGAFLLVINQLFELSRDTEKLFANLGFAQILLAPIGFIIFIIHKDFSKIVNNKLASIFSSLNLIPIIAVFIFSANSLLFQVTLIFMILNSFYIIFVQIRLIKISMGKIKTRLIQFFIGEILGLVALVFAAQITFNIISIPKEIIFFIGTTILIIGFLIIFMSVYNFPPFYEFEWRENLLRFIVFSLKYNLVLYFREFNNERDKNVDVVKEVYSKELVGLDEITAKIIADQEAQLNLIRHGDFLLLLERNLLDPNPIAYVLVVKKDLSTYRAFIKILREEFETFFKEVLMSFEEIEFNKNKQSIIIFQSFNQKMKEILGEGG
ncbi:MAG: hypothetical protein ACTSR8_07000 [Promethearchaeota archaeon]